MVICYKCNGNHYANQCNLYCIRCNRTNHNISNCYAKTYKNGKKINDDIITEIIKIKKDIKNVFYKIKKLFK